MQSAFAVFLRGFTLPFGVTSGTRIVFNGVDGLITFYNSANRPVLTLGRQTFYGGSEATAIAVSSGDVEEDVPGLIRAVALGAVGTTRRAILNLWSPAMPTGALSEVAELDLQSRSVDGTFLPSISLFRADGGYLGRIFLLSDKLSLGSGANRVVGEATLVAGTVTVPNTAVEAGTLIFLSRRVAGGTLGFLRYSRIAGVSFTITSSSATDTSTVSYMLVNPG